MSGKELVIIFAGLLGSFLSGAPVRGFPAPAQDAQETDQAENQNVENVKPNDPIAHNLSGKTLFPNLADAPLRLKKNFEPDFDTPLPASNFTWTGLGRTFLSDQKSIWTSPSRLGFADAQWLVPMVGFTAAFIATDRGATLRISRAPATIQRYRNLSNGGLVAMNAAAGGMVLWSLYSKNDHQRETGFLAEESALNSFLAVEAIKYVAQRQRPYQSDGSGHFFRSGSSFPSAHAAIAWSIAGVVAHEYPGPFTKFLAYGFATAISASRIQSRDHFPSDVFVGSSLGWMIAQSVYRRRHDPELGGGEWRSFGEFVREKGSGASGRLGTTYVPLDSGVYPAIERLAALGLADTAFLGTRPWTRLECAHLVQDATDKWGDAESGASGAGNTIQALQREFRDVFDALAGNSNAQLAVNSLYTRFTGINGQPLQDSEHFGQTFINDFGRPYREGFNNVSGFTASGTYGIFSVYAQGEYQHAPSAAAYPLAARQAISVSDNAAVSATVPFAEINQFRLLNTYVGVNLEDWELTFGKQSLWWGPGDGSSLLMSDNAEPIYMFRASRISPFTLPWILGKLGPAKVDLFFGKLSGHTVVPRPVIHGERISFKPTPNLELGFSRTAVLGGVGRPLTLGAIWNSYFSFTSSTNYADNVNPGKRNGGFDFSYRVPYLRNWLTIYADSISDDDPSPLAAPRRAGIVPGFYLSHVPKIPKLDLRFEAGYTDTSTSRSVRGSFIYWDAFYHDFYSNKGYLLGSWIGREGQGFQASSTYWFRPKTRLKFHYRHARVDGDFIPGGGSQSDASVEADFPAFSQFQVSSVLQYEHWNIPVLAQQAQSNVSMSLQLTIPLNARIK